MLLVFVYIYIRESWRGDGEMGGEGREGVRVEYICLEQEAKPAGGTKTKPGLVESIGR